MLYTIKTRNSYQVEFTTKPEEYQAYLKTPECIKRDTPDEKANLYRKGIPVKVDVTVEMSETEDLKSVPKAIMSHAVKDINVAIATTLRPLAGFGTFEKRYDVLKEKLSRVQTFTATIEAAKKGAREKVSPTGKVIDRLLVAYGAEKVASHMVAISDKIKGGADPDALILEYATMFEREAMKRK